MRTPRNSPIQVFTASRSTNSNTQKNYGKSGKISTNLLTTYFKRKMSVSVLFEFSKNYLYIKSANLVKTALSSLISLTLKYWVIESSKGEEI